MTEQMGGANQSVIHQRLSAGGLSGGGGYHNFEQDLSPVSLEIDSAFSDTLSLPSSGSHGSVATSGSGSQHSGGSSGSGGTGGGASSSGSSGVSSGAECPPLSPVGGLFFFCVLYKNVIYIVVCVLIIPLHVCLCFL